MKLLQSIQTDDGIFAPGEEAALLRSKGVATLDWDHLANRGILRFASADERARLKGDAGETGKKLRGAAAKAAQEKAAREAAEEAAAAAEQEAAETKAAGEAGTTAPEGEAAPAS